MSAAATERADVVIVGGGAIGASTAYHLSRLGVTDVVLVEREVLASGSTGRSVGGIRLQYGDELNIRIVQRSLAELQRFPAIVAEAGADVDVDIDLRQNGYLILLDSEEQLGFFRDALEVQHALGVPSRELTPAQVAELVPQLEVEDLVGATYCPTDGRAVPDAVVQGYAAAAIAKGLRLRQGCAVTGIRRTGGRIEAVETTKGEILTDTVVCAAGAWSAEVAALVELDLPVRGEPHWVFFSREDGGLPDTLPLIVDFSSGFYVIRETHGMIFGGRVRDVGELAEPAVRRLPLMAEIPVESSWWGLYDMSPDNNAIVGRAPGLDGFLFATGFSGHGFQQAPAVGEHLAELVVGAPPALDLGGFGLERFADGDGRPERFYL
jgi:sarcosine oxidase, subunit beta